MPILEKKKELIFDDLAGPVRKIAIPQQGLRQKLTKLHIYGHKTPRRFTRADKSNTKAHTLMVKFIVAIYSNIYLLFLFSPKLLLMTVVSLANLHIDLKLSPVTI